MRYVSPPFSPLPSPTNSIGSDLDPLLQKNTLHLFPLTIHKPRRSSSPCISPNSANNITVRRKNNRGSRHFRGRKGTRNLDLQDSSLIDIPITTFSGPGPLRAESLVLAVIWDPRGISASTLRCLGGILISVKLRGCADRINILNVYAPCKDRASYWEHFIASGIMENEALLIARDLNSTLDPDEVWGKGKKADAIGEKIKEAMLQFNYVDICPKTLSPTWDNGRSGDAYIAKRLDRFIMHEQLMEKFGIPNSHTLPVFISDHRPVSLQWMNSKAQNGYPFKFNRYWLEDESFNSMIQEFWMADWLSADTSPLEYLIGKLGSLKSMVKKWKIQKKQINSVELKNIEKELVDIAETMTSNSIPWSSRNRIWELERKKQQILKFEEISWRLKSCATWLREGDKNTKFFHHFANKRRATNSIWQIKNENGDLLHSQDDISNEVVKHFKNAYKRESNREFKDILWGIDPFPCMFKDEDNEIIYATVSEEELLSVMWSFKKDKCPSPDGWTIDIFIHFFDFMKKGHLGDERIRGNLSAHISREQHGFLIDRNILDVVAITQEALHSMHTRNIGAAILKIDLKKAFDSLDWSFLRCLLIKIALNVLCTNWLMACVQDINFTILINGFPTIFFRAEKGLRQGCSLSPILFILAMDSLSLHIKRVITAGKVGPLAISRGNLHTHNLFVDDILLFARLCRKTWQILYEIILSFQKATGLSINEGKSSFHFVKVIEAEMEYISRLYNIQAISIKEGLKYLGFHLKPTRYNYSDWSWLTDKFYKIISGWEFKCLSLAGRMILAQSVLAQICVY
eukprot:PITA_29310